MIGTVQVVLAGERTLGGQGERLGVVEYTIDHNRDPLQVVIRGEITLPEMAALHEELFKDIGGRFRRMLMDITAARIAMSDDELREMAELMAKDSRADRAWIAVVVGDRRDYALGRNIQIRAGNVHTHERLFYSYDEALEWLEGHRGFF